MDGQTESCRDVSDDFMQVPMRLVRWRICTYTAGFLPFHRSVVRTGELEHVVGHPFHCVFTMADRSASPPIIPVSLTDYPRTESVYQGVDDDRNLLFRQFLYDGWQTTERKPLESPALVALGLTEVCSRVGFGKVCIRYYSVGPMLTSASIGQVFYFPLPFVAQKWVERTAAKDAAARIIWAIKRMPELIYVPYVWHPKDVANWKDITHAGK